MSRRFIASGVLGAFLLWGAAATASLEIYHDGVKYRYVPVDTYVGFVQGAEARCGEKEIPLVLGDSCPETKRLCKERAELERVEQERDALKGAEAMIGAWSQSARPTEMDAARWIAAAEKMGKRRAQWRAQAARLESEWGSRTRRFREETSSESPRFLAQPCKGELTLTLPAGLIDLQFLNTVEVGKETIAITYYLSLRNHSGVDLTAKSVQIYARDFRRALRPTPFRPWRIEVKEAKGARAEHPKGTVARSDDVPTEPSRRLRERRPSRDYAIDKIDLPSTGEEIRVRIDSYEVPKGCELISDPWRDSAVYLACRFKPKSPVETPRWIVKKGGRLLTENAYGEYRLGRYLLYVDRDDTVQIRRIRLPDKARSRQLSGGRLLLRDGYILEIKNRSSQQKRIRIVERIPVSRSEKVKVKLAQVEGAIEESLSEEGELVMQVLLAPGEEKRIKVLFELSVEKGVKVFY